MVDPVNILIGYKHVSPGTMMVGDVTIIKNHYCVLHVDVNEVDPEVGPNQGPPGHPSTRHATSISALGNETH